LDDNDIVCENNIFYLCHNLRSEAWSECFKSDFSRGGSAPENAGRACKSLRRSPDSYSRMGRDAAPSHNYDPPHSVKNYPKIAYLYSVYDFHNK